MQLGKRSDFWALLSLLLACCRSSTSSELGMCIDTLSPGFFLKRQPVTTVMCLQDLEGREAAAQDNSELGSKAGSSARRTSALAPATSQTVPGWMLDKV